MTDPGRDPATAPDMTTDVAPHDPYAALRHREFRWYIISLFAMTLASQLQAVVVGWQVYAITHDPLSLGLIGLAEALPFIACALPAGYLADRHDRRMLSVAALAVLAACSLALLALSATPTLRAGTVGRTGITPVHLIYAIIFASGIARSVLQPARQAMGAELVPRSMYQNAVAWRSSSWQTAAVIGPAVGGLLYGFAGAVASYAVDAALMTFALVGFLVVRYQPLPRALEETSVVTSLLIGLRFVLSQPVILGALSLDLFSVFLGGAEALLPVFAAEILMVGPQGLGILRAAPAAGAVLMGVYLAHRPPIERAGRVLLVAVATFALAIIGFGLSRSFGLSLALLAVSGMADNISVVIRSTLLQLLTPPEMLGRVSAVNSVFIGSSNELGAFESGVMAKLLGTVPTVVMGGLASLLVVGVTARLVPKLRQLGRIGG
ncbi:MAG: transporter [Gemmatimonadetes bacterium]|nr:transporter [Gemmatimonadota bacterium]